MENGAVPAESDSKRKIVKVRIPTRHLIALHYLKLTRQLDLSEIVARALESYFAQHPVPAGAASSPASAGFEGALPTR